MGLDISIKGMSYEDTYHCGYITFGLYRCAVATAYNKEFGEIYEKPYKNFFYESNEEDIKRWNELCNDDLDLFLNHSDCGGKLTWKECKKIYDVMKDLKVNMRGHNYATMNEYDMHQQWLNMFKFCATKRVNMYFW
ncbi:hypothetical protein ACWG0P_07225 [Amedibacillus sp. YH-ame6]